MGIGRRIISFFRRKKPLERQLQVQFRAETKRIAAQKKKVTSPVAKKLIAEEVKRRKQIGKGKTDGRIIRFEDQGNP